MQSTLHRFTDDTDDTDDWPPFEEYGPTMDQPIPDAEACLVPWKQRMRERGFCPDCLLESTAGNGRYRGVDAHRRGQERVEAKHAPWTIRQEYDVRA